MAGKDYPALGIITYNRPLHTALCLAFAMYNKHARSDIHVFYSIHADAEPKSKTLDALQKHLLSTGKIASINYIPGDQPCNAGTNVDNLVVTLQGMKDQYACMFKLDDDVLIGPNTDMIMTRILLATENEKDNVMIIGGQVISGRIVADGGFAWTKQVGDHMIAQRPRNHAVMETYTALSFNMVPQLQAAGRSIGTDTWRGDYWSYARKFPSINAKQAAVLYPAISMQHIGFTTTILNPGEPPRLRNWAPCRSYNPPGHIVHVPGFDFSMWERGHSDGSLPDYTREVLLGLRTRRDDKGLNKVLADMAEIISTYNPDATNEPPLPDDPAIIRNAARNLHGDAHVIRRIPHVRVDKATGRRMVVRR